MLKYNNKSVMTNNDKGVSGEKMRSALGKRSRKT